MGSAGPVAKLGTFGGSERPAGPGRPGSGSVTTGVSCGMSVLVWVAPSAVRIWCDAEDVCGLDRRVEAHIIGVAPPVGSTRELVGDNESGLAVHSERRQVKPDRGLTSLMRIQVYYDQDSIPTAVTHPLGEAEQFRLVSVVEPDITQPVQRRGGFPDRVEPPDVGRDALRPDLRLSPVPRPVGILLRIEILLTPGPDRDVLRQ